MDTFADRAVTEAFYTREYEPSRMIPDHESIRQGWLRSSEIIRAEHPCVLDVPYGLGERERIDVFPARRYASPTVIFIHGGYWRALDRRSFSFVAPAFTALGAACFIPSYGLAPLTPMESIVLQVQAAIRWVHDNAAQYGADPDQLFLVGHSAGAHLLAMAMAAAAEDGAAGANLIRGGLAISGVYDLRPLLHVPLLNADLQLTPERAAALSPVLMRPGGRAPLWTSVGGIEPNEFLRQTRLIEREWSEVWAGHIAMPESNHLSILNHLASADNPLNDAIATLLDSGS
ncbi:MAG: alpha/beta hydrolase [Lautropia sp.]